MELVLAFRQFDRPVRFEEFRGIRARAPWCLDIYRLTYHGSFLASDGYRMVCRYTAPDAESVRIPSRQHDVPFERITAVDADGPARDEAAGDLGGFLATNETLVAAEPIGLPPADAAAMRARFLLTYRARDGKGDLHLFAMRASGLGAPNAGSPPAKRWAARLYLPAAHPTSASR